MVANLQFSIQGGTELKAALEKLPDGMGEKICAAALRAGAKVFTDEIKATAPIDHKAFTATKQEVRTRTKKTKEGQVTELIHVRDQVKITSVKTDAKQTSLKIYNGKAFWAQFLEFGTSKMSAKPFWRPAFERMKIAALQVIGNSLGKGIEDKAAKLAGPLSKSGLIKK